MSRHNQERHGRLSGHKKQVAETLKCCPLCGAVNASINTECFKCCWHGAFDTDPKLIEAGLSELLVMCPELAEAMDEAPLLRPSLFRRIANYFRDLRAHYIYRKVSKNLF
jgi:hypothetical protein